MKTDRTDTEVLQYGRNQRRKKIYLVGIYCRLSKDDGTDNESASIATQKSILTDYVKKQGWHIAKTYVDDGYSGTNFVWG